jgi:DNA-binding transcriptional ArsR family regulator
VLIIFLSVKTILPIERSNALDDPERSNTFLVRDYDTLKVIADPLRAQIVELLLREPLNVRQVADRLGLAPSKLYYHFGLLEKIGLVVVADTRQIANIVEKTYRLAAPNIEVEPSLFNFNTQAGQDNLNTALVATLDTTRDDVLRSVQARYTALESGTPPRPRNMMLSRVLSRISDERADEFKRRLAALLQEFDTADSDASAQTYALMVAFYPSFHYRTDPPTQGAAPDTT